MRWLKLSALILATHASLVVAARAEPSTPLDDESAHETVGAAKPRAYAEVLARYFAAERSDPSRVDLIIARCRFTAAYADEDDGDWIESASADHEGCLQELRTRWPDAPAARVFLYQQEWNSTSSQQAEELLEASGSWPDPVRRDLFAALSKHHASKKSPVRSREFALQAARLGERERLPLAIERLVELDEQNAAVDLLSAAPPAENAWEARRRIAAAAKLDDPHVALIELQRYGSASFRISAASAAPVHMRLGDHVTARALLDKEQADSEQLRALRFENAQSMGDDLAAGAQIRIEDVANIGENLQRFALLLGRSPVAWFQPTMYKATAAVACIFIFLVLLPGLLLVPVHYRGLARRVKGRVPKPLFASVGLRHAWWGLAVAFALPLLVGACLEPGSVAAIMSDDTLPAPYALFRMMAWGTLASLVVMMPQIVRLGRVALVGNLQTLRYGGWVIAAWIALFAISWVQSAWHASTLVDTTTLQTKMVDALVNAESSQVSVAARFLTLVVLVPIFEELIFRGLLLGGMARHISFGWANFAQALLFACIHTDPPRFVSYLALGLLAGYLTRRSSSLGPAIALHALNNGIAFVLLLR